MLVASGLVACSDATSGPSPASPRPSPSAVESPADSASPEPLPDPTPTQEPDDGATTGAGGNRADRLPPVRHRVSLAALMRQRLGPTRVRFQRLQGAAAAYTRHEVTYRSGDLTVSGVLLRPRGRGPFPGIVLNHGYIDPAFYVTGQGLAREQDWLARAGFVVLHTDYRGHARSDPIPARDRETRLGYTLDAINAVRALKREPYVDGDRMAMLGRSMGGGVTLNALVVRPGLVDAAVVYASVSSRFLTNLRHFTQRNRPEAVESLFARFGTPREEPAFYRGLSSRTHFDRVTEPVLMHHGTADETCPFPWARTTQRLLTEAGADSRLEVYEGERHAFVPQWQDSIEATVRFLRRELGPNRG
ncbi:alpha/beta hydrolase family protein [Nocardioides sp. GCM10027113]|uniref:alpha/beta hydrolase family protein n=1 Tax=unclassified Nocardioides TaxID=2615069 RepID=UPI0036122719